MSLRLLPAIIMDNDEDDDGNFTKWMSSYWGHSSETGHSRERKRSFRRPAKTQGDRRASLPTVVRPADREKGEVRPHQRARRSSSDDNSRGNSALQEIRFGTIPELTESFEKRLFLRDKRTTSLVSTTPRCKVRCVLLKIQKLSYLDRFEQRIASRPHYIHINQHFLILKILSNNDVDIKGLHHCSFEFGGILTLPNLTLLNPFYALLFQNRQSSCSYTSKL
uniref:Leukemia NUP98 fusion partner 1 n=1 Tax=Labrus bergylta TaxID=56723 RepID=A0A3Q3GJQ0_9LABR